MKILPPSQRPFMVMGWPRHRFAIGYIDGRVEFQEVHNLPEK
jgi:hypothetical protein